jgi:hypothetical protein
MKVSYQVQTSIDLDAWMVLAIRDIMEKLGRITPRDSDQAVLGAFAHDMFHETALELDFAVQDSFFVELPAKPKPKLSADALAEADNMEFCWTRANTQVRGEFLERLGAWYNKASRVWSLSLFSPALHEVKN